MYFNRCKEIMDKMCSKGLVASIKYLIYMIENRERQYNNGDLNPQKTFYVIRSINASSKFYTGVELNLLANYSYVISHLMYAIQKGYIPVIDQLNYPVYNQEPFVINGTKNPWEYFWQQPYGITLDEAYKSKNVVLSKRSWYQPGNPEYSIYAHTNNDSIKKYNALMNLVPLNERTSEHCVKTKEKIFEGKKRILGVSMRNAGYATNSCFHAPGHPIQPSIEELITIVKKKFVEWQADSIFLATEENENVKKFKEVFGKRIIVYERNRYYGWKKFTNEDPNPLYIAGEKYKTTLDYLTEMELLANCNFLIGSITSGFRYAVFRNNAQYEHLEILDYGKFSYSNSSRI